MAIIRLDCNLNGGDSVTPNNELFYRIYGDVDSYTAPIHTTGTALSDANVTVDNDNVIITGVDGTTNTEFKIAAVDGAGNEGILSDAFSYVVYYLLRIESGDAYLFEDNDSYTEVVDPKTTNYEFTFNPTDFSVTRYLLESGEYNKSTCGRFTISVSSSGFLSIGRADESNANAVAVSSTTSLIAGQDNTISLINGVLIVNGVDQLIDISAWDTITTRSIAGGGTTFFATELAGQGGFVGDVKAITYKGTALGFSASGMDFKTFSMTEYGTKEMIPY